MFHPSLGYVRCPHNDPKGIVGVEVQGVYDGVLYWLCKCGAAWHRFDYGDSLRTKAEPYVKDANRRRQADA